MKRSILFRAGVWALGILFIGSTGIYAQSETAFNEIRFLTRQEGIGTRALAMGGAFSPVANDYSSAFWNPGGLAFLKSFELYGALSNNKSSNSVSAFNTLSEASQNFTRLNSFGIIIPVPVRRGGLTLALGINKPADYSSVFGVAGFNHTEENEVFQQQDISEEGGLSTATIAGGIQVARNVGIGMTVNFWFGSHQYSSSFYEQDELNLYTLDEYLNDQFVDSRIHGADLTVGVLYKATPNLRVGFTITTPQYFSITEDYSVQEDYYYDSDSGLEDELYDDSGTFDYEVVLPYKFGIGLAYVSDFFTFGGSVEYRDWSQTRYVSEPPVSGLNRVEANRDIRLTTQSVLTKRLGAEMNLGMFAVRAGYAIVPTPYKRVSRSHDQKHTSFGLGVRLSRTVAFDITWLRSRWDSQTVDDLINTPVLEERKDNKIIAGLSVKFR